MNHRDLTYIDLEPMLASKIYIQKSFDVKLDGSGAVETGFFYSDYSDTNDEDPEQWFIKVVITTAIKDKKLDSHLELYLSDNDTRNTLNMPLGVTFDIGIDDIHSKSYSINTEHHIFSKMFRTHFQKLASKLLSSKIPEAIDTIKLLSVDIADNRDAFNIENPFDQCVVAVVDYLDANEDNRKTDTTVFERMANFELKAHDLEYWAQLVTDDLGKQVLKATFKNDSQNYCELPTDKSLISIRLIPESSTELKIIFTLMVDSIGIYYGRDTFTIGQYPLGWSRTERDIFEIVLHCGVELDKSFTFDKFFSAYFQDKSRLVKLKRASKKI